MTRSAGRRRLGCRLLAASAALGLALFWPLAVRATPVEDLQARLKDPSSIRRFEAIDALGALGTPEAVQALIDILGDEENGWLAVRQLVRLRGDAIPSLNQALSSPNLTTLKHAIYALGELQVRESVNLLLPYLTHPEAEIRQNTVFALGSIGSPRTVDPLIARLRDSDNVVREYAAAALEHMRDTRAIPALREALRTEKGAVFNMATALYNMGAEDVIDLLLEKLRDPAAQNRLYAVYALGKIKDPREVDPLIECLTDENVQWLAVKALINLGDMAVPSLRKALSNRNNTIRLYATYALGEIGDAKAAGLIVEGIIDPDPLIRDYSSDALIKLRDRVVIPRLLYYLEKGDPSIQSQVLKVLGSFGDSSVAGHVYTLLGSSSSQVRMNAAYALGELRDIQGVASLVKLLADPAPGVAAMATNALQKIGQPATEEVLKLLPSLSGRSEMGAIQVLGKLKYRKAVEPILRRLLSPETAIRRTAVVALTEIGDPAVEEHFVMLLSDTDPQVRMFASIGLMQFGGRLSVKLLLNALRSEETRWLAVRILDRIGPRGVDEIIKALKDPNLQLYATQTLTKLDGNVLPQLEEGLRSDDEAIRNNIAVILGEVKDKRAVRSLLLALQDESRNVSLAAMSLVSIGDASAVEPLIQCLTHQNDQVRLYAAYALGKMKDARAIDPLIAILRSKDLGMRGIAAYSLGQLQAKKAFQPLLDLLQDPDEEVRISVVYALGKIGQRDAVAFLQERLQKDSSNRVRAAAKQAMESLTFGH